MAYFYLFFTPLRTPPPPGISTPPPFFDIFAIFTL
jgi:hypothetical protein